MTIFKANSQGNDYISMGEAINKQRIVFYIQLFLNLIITIWFVKNKSTHNWQLMVVNMIALFVLHFVVFLFTFVTVN
jgi:hypothetical protein